MARLEVRSPVEELWTPATVQTLKETLWTKKVTFRHSLGCVAYGPIHCIIEPGWFCRGKRKEVTSKGALTLGHRYRAWVCLSLDRLASVSTPSVLKHSSTPWPQCTLVERCVCSGHGTDANEPTRAHARIRNLYVHVYTICMGGDIHW